MQLSPHFSLNELIKSQQALRLGINNKPGDAEITNLKRLTIEILEPIRSHFGAPFSPSSGYRCPALNAAIGSKETSQHIRGEAADFEVPGIDNADLARWVRDHLEFDQIILEFYDGSPSGGWVHCSLRAADNRSESLTVGKKRAMAGLPEEAAGS